MKIAILGASGIGKNHAGWFAGHGCEIVAFLGSSQDSIAGTAPVLESRLGYTVPGFTDLAELIRTSRPDAVCISTPPQLHFEQATQCLEAGLHVLCEKPLVGDDVAVDSFAWQKIVAEADALVQQAQEKQLVFGTQMQYAHATPIVRELTGLGDAPLRHWSMIMETKNVRPGRGGEQIWIDLSPHPLSVLQKLAGPIEIDWTSACCKVEQNASEAYFQVRIEGQAEACDARVIVRCNPDRAVPQRRIEVNGIAVDYAARKNAAGDFKSFFSVDESEVEAPDLVDILIGNFVRACRGEEALLATGADGARNVEMQLRLLTAGGNDVTS